MELEQSTCSSGETSQKPSQSILLLGDPINISNDDQLAAVATSGTGYY
ncbi:MAG: hypothetical protein ACW991_06920 [Candidatus Hodarchaeales archaeon]